MTTIKKYNILGVFISSTDYSSACASIIDAAHHQKSLGVTALAVHGVMTGALDCVQRARLNALDLVVPDGQPVRWALNLVHRQQLTDRVYGPTLMLKVCAKAAKQHLPIYLYGSKPQILNALQKNLQNQFPELIIAGSQPSRFRTLTRDEKLADVEVIKASGARLVFVGMGCPRQETWVYEHLHHLPMPMLAVGAAFDFHAGYLAQAPSWMQSRGLEWLFRLVKEPERLWKRYVLLNPLFIALLFLQWRGIHSLSNAENVGVIDIRYG